MIVKNIFTEQAIVYFDPTSVTEKKPFYNIDTRLIPTSLAPPWGTMMSAWTIDGAMKWSKAGFT
jgi:hypothetical protein